MLCLKLKYINIDLISKPLTSIKMVIIAAVVCDQEGKIVLARCFSKINKMSLEEQVKNFPKSIRKTQ